MGAIFGYSGFEDNNLIRKMSRASNHRSPSGFRYYKNKSVTLGQGIFKVGKDCCHCPITNEEENLVLLCAGRVFKSDIIKSFLISKGHEFKTDFSGEVILHLYEEYGMNFLDKINGDFGFCIYDCLNGKIILCSDHSGSKPIYYFKEGENIVFASDIKSILQYDQFEKKLDKHAVDLFLIYLTLPTERTLFQEIKRVMPSTFVVFDSGSVKKVKYFRVKENINYSKREDFFIKKTKIELERAVEDRIIGDVPIHVCLGGLDSSSVTGILASKVDEINTYTLGFGNTFNERDFARKVSEMHGTNHHEIHFETKIADKFYKENLQHFSSPPVMDMGAVVSHNIISRLKESGCLLFNGDGADEIFGGLRNESMISQRKLLKIPRLVINSMKEFLTIFTSVLELTAGMLNSQSNCIERLKLYEYWFLLKESGLLERAYANLTPTFFFELYKVNGKLENNDLFVFSNYLNEYNLHFINRLMKLNLEFRSYMGELIKNEILCTSHGLVNNCPFLDRKLIEFSFQVPVKYKFKKNYNKILLAKATRDILPEVCEIKKSLFVGGGLDIFNSYFKCNNSVVKDLFDKSELFRNFRRDFLDNIIEPFSGSNKKIYHPSRKHYNDISKIHTLFSLGLWYEHYFNDEKLERFF